MAAPPGYRTLDLTLISAKDLKDVSGLFSSKMECYAVASLSGDPRSRQRTPTDHEGNRDPTWNSPMKFYVPAVPGPASGGIVLEVVIRCEKALGDKDVGEVHIPVRELESDAASAGAGSKADSSAPRFLSYQVRRPSGNPKGVLNFSYKFGEPAVAAVAAPPPPPVAAPVGYQPHPAGAPYGYPPPPATAYPPPTSSSSSAAAAAPEHKSNEPVAAYPAPPAATPYAVPAAAAYPPPPAAAYPAYPPPAPGYGAPPAPGYGYPPPPPAGYGYGPPPPYGYAGQPVAPQQPPKKGGSKFGLGLGAGLLGGALGGLIIGDAISDATSGFDDVGGGFDF